VRRGGHRGGSSPRGKMLVIPPGGNIAGPLQVCRRAHPRHAAADCRRPSATLVPVRLAAGDEADLEDVIRAARRHRLRPAVEMVAKRGELAVARADCSTCSRRRRSTRCGSSSSATNRRRDPPSFKGRRPALGRPGGARACGPRPAGNWLLTPLGSRPGPRSWRLSTRAFPRSSARSPTGITVEGMEAFSSVLADRMDLLLDYLPLGGVVLAC